MKVISFPTRSKHTGIVFSLFGCLDIVSTLIDSLTIKQTKNKQTSNELKKKMSFFPLLYVYILSL